MGADYSEEKIPKKENESKENTKKGEIKDEGITNNVPPIPERASKKLYNSIFRIIVNHKEGKIMGTGFFIRLNLKNETKLFLVICYHIIQKNFIDEKITIALYYGEYDNEKKFNIKLDERERYIKCFDRPIDVTLSWNNWKRWYW